MYTYSSGGAEELCVCICVCVGGRGLGEETNGEPGGQLPFHTLVCNL